MEFLLNPIIEETYLVRISVTMVYGSSFSSCLSNFCRLLQRCVQKTFGAQLEKCHFIVSDEIVLGHKILEHGIEIDKAKIEMMIGLQPPNSVKGIRSFLGHA